MHIAGHSGNGSESWPAFEKETKLASLVMGPDFVDTRLIRGVTFAQMAVVSGRRPVDQLPAANAAA